MPPLFAPKHNLIARASVVAVALLIVGICVVGYAWTRSSYQTKVGIAVSQPVPFSHAHHVGGLGIDCRYCHTTVETAATAGMPSTQTCMNCHAQLWTDAEMLEPVRVSWRTGERLAWNRVHDLPDFVYFDHSIHVNKGIGCATCHGEVDRMPLVYKTESLFMQWCLDCHREPEKFIRPRHAVFDLNWQRPKAYDETAEMLMNRYHVQVDGLTDCTRCHR